MPRTVPIVIRSFEQVAAAYRRPSLAPELASLWRPVSADAATRAWYRRAVDEPQPRATTLFEAARRIVGHYDASALTRAYSMRVLGTSQWDRLLPPPLGSGGQRRGSLLDVGAGEGDVTDELAPLFDRVVTTETSGPTAKRLRERGWACYETDLTVERLPEEEFDVVSLLNVLDRTAFPKTLLRNAGDRVREGGHLVVALPVPVRTAVLSGPVKVHPYESIPTNHDDWAEGVAQLCLWFASFGLRVISVSRAPYLSRGDRRSLVTALDDAIFVMERVKAVALR